MDKDFCRFATKMWTTRLKPVLEWHHKVQLFGMDLRKTGAEWHGNMAADCHPPLRLGCGGFWKKAAENPCAAAPPAAPGARFLVPLALCLRASR
jgi:hypothetical protein